MTTAWRWSRAKLILQRRQEFSRTRGGRLIGADLGPALWRAEFQSFPLRRDPADQLHSDFLSLRGVVHPFYLHPAERPRPAASTGQALAGVTLQEITAERDGVRLQGLPAGFVMTPGDFLSVTTSAGGREFLRIVGVNSAGVADGAGLSPRLWVEPAVRVSAVVGNAVTLANPLLEAALEPETLDRIEAGLGWFRVTFSAWQVVR